MAMKCDRVAIFRGPIIGSALRKAPETKSKFIDLRCKVEDYWNGKEWEDWRQYDMEAYGSLCIVKSNGEIHTIQAEAMLNHAGWDGDFSHLGDGYALNSVRFKTAEETYQKDGQTHSAFKIDFIDDYNATPGGGLKSNVDESDAKALNAQFGAQLRALKGNGQRNATKPAGCPATPPAASAPINSPEAVAAAQAGQDGIPF